VRNGDIANKIGTYNLAVLANHHDIPFYTAFPSSTYDSQTPTGNEIVIEERESLEIFRINGYSEEKEDFESITVYSQNTNFINPAFDVTSTKLIQGYITPYGILSQNELYEKLGTN
jgi:methylthioribose-1-phosphate isomerase